MTSAAADLRRAHARAIEELAARRRRLDTMLALAQVRPDDVDPVDLIDSALAAEAAETLVERLAGTLGDDR